MLNKPFPGRTACATGLLPLLLLTLPAVVQAQFTYTTNNGTIAISRYTGPGGAVVIPDTINGLPVTDIGGGAFYGNTSLTSLTIPNSVTFIGDSPFVFCSSLTTITVDPLNSVYSSLDGVLFDKNQTLLIQFPGGKAGSYTIPNNVTNIGNSAFSSCVNLTSITIPNSVTSIGGYAFSWCFSLASVTIPSSVTSIGGGAFIFCDGLTSVAIPNGVTSIGHQAFSSCHNISSVTIPSSVTNIWGYAFASCDSLSAITVDALNSSYSSVEGVLFNKSRGLLIQCPGGKAGSYAIPNSVIGIGEGAFSSCFSLTSVTIPNSVTSIGDNAFGSCIGITNILIPDSVISIGSSAFYGCSSITRIALHDSVTNIGYFAFSECTNLSAIAVDALNSFYSSVDGVLFNKSQTLLMQCPAGKAGSYKIPNGVTRIGDSAFQSCASLTNVIIPNSVTSIEDYAFFYCTSLASVAIPNSVTSIGSGAFFHCTSLTEVYFLGNVPAVGSSVFAYADNATLYYLPGTTGWGTTFAGRPAVLWNAQVKSRDASFGVQANRFGFAIFGSSNLVVVVEATTNLANPVWTPVGTNTLTGGSSYFSDPQWTTLPVRFYRLRPP